MLHDEEDDTGSNTHVNQGLNAHAARATFLRCCDFELSQAELSLQLIYLSDLSGIPLFEAIGRFALFFRLLLRIFYSLLALEPN